MRFKVKNKKGTPLSNPKSLLLRGSMLELCLPHTVHTHGPVSTWTKDPHPTLMKPSMHSWDVLLWVPLPLRDPILPDRGLQWHPQGKRWFLGKDHFCFHPASFPCRPATNISGLVLFIPPSIFSHLPMISMRSHFFSLSKAVVYT